MKSNPAHSLSSIQLIAFDLDGTLANTEAVSIPSAVATLRDEFGVPITLDYFYENLHGLTGQALATAIYQQLGIKLDAAAYMQRRAEMVPGMFASGVQPAPGMLQALRNLVAAGQQLCICSNSMPERIAYTLNHITGQHSAGINLPSLFEGHLFSATGTSGTGQAKPAPDVYLAAAAAYKANPKKCLAVEDSPVGVASAIAAGFTCLGYNGLTRHADDEAANLTAAGAKAVFRHWDDFIPLLSTLKI